MSACSWVVNEQWSWVVFMCCIMPSGMLCLPEEAWDVAPDPSCLKLFAASDMCPLAVGGRVCYEGRLSGAQQ